MMNEPGVIGGELTPYLLSDDEWITGILIGCFVITACILSQGKILLLQSLRKLFSTHEIGHLFHQVDQLGQVDLLDQIIMVLTF